MMGPLLHSGLAEHHAVIPWLTHAPEPQIEASDNKGRLASICGLNPLLGRVQMDKMW